MGLPSENHTLYKSNHLLRLLASQCNMELRQLIFHDSLTNNVSFVNLKVTITRHSERIKLPSVKIRELKILDVEKINIFFFYSTISKMYFWDVIFKTAKAKTQ